MKCSSVDTISLDNIMPRFFSESDVQGSEVWKSDLVLHKGRYYMIEAASGKGKSSLCNFIFGLRKDYSGTIRFDGRDVAAFGPWEWRNLRRVSISMMFQDLDLFEELTALENIRIKNDITGYFSPGEIESLMRQTGILALADRPVSSLSAGERQRVAFIRALAQPFDFIVMDEPVSHLDAANAGIMGEIMDSQARKMGAGIIVTSLGNPLPLSYDAVFGL